MKNKFLNIILVGFLGWAPIYRAQATVLPSLLKGENLLDGKMLEIETKSPEKKGLVVIFMSAKCPCSNSHVAEVQKLSAEYPDFRFVAVHSNSDESKEKAKTYFQNMSFPFPVIEDEKTKIADLLHANKTPHSFIISNDGQILYRGGVTNSANAANADKHFLKEALEEIHQGHKVSMAEGRTLGCAIIREDD